MSLQTQWFLPDADATEALGARLAQLTPPGFVTLEGVLGAGKTTFVRGFLRALGHVGSVRSPTYTLVEPYRLGEVDIVHMDLYRLTDPAELEELGVRDYFGAGTWVFVEWPERGAGVLPKPDLRLKLAPEGHGRRAEAVAAGPLGRNWLQQL